jgi:WD40 repeat protein
VFVFDTLTGDVVQQLRAHTNVVRDVSWHPTRPVLVSSGWDQLLAVWTRRDMTHPQARAAASAAAATNEDLRAGRTAVVARGRHDDDDDGDDEDFQGGDDAEDGDDDDDDDDDDYVALRQQDAPRR